MTGRSCATIRTGPRSAASRRWRRWSRPERRPATRPAAGTSANSPFPSSSGRWAPQVCGRASWRRSSPSSWSRPPSLPLLPLFALPLALASKRGGRTPGMIVAVASLAAFHQAVEFFKGLVVNGRLGSPAPIWTAMVVFALLCLGIHLASRRRPGDNPVTRGGARIALWTKALRAKLARLPRPAFGGGGYSGLPAYITGLFARRTGFACLGLIAFFQIVDMQEMGPKILARGLGAAGLVHFEALRLPAMALQLGGLAILIGAVSTFSALGQRSESVAMQACGVSPYRIILAAAPVALVVAVLEFGLASEIGPHAQAALDGWWSRTAPAEARADPLSHWLRLGPDLLHVDDIADHGRTLRGVALYRRDPAGLLLERAATAQVRWSRGLAGRGGPDRPAWRARRRRQRHASGTLDRAEAQALRPARRHADGAGDHATGRHLDPGVGGRHRQGPPRPRHAGPARLRRAARTAGHAAAGLPGCCWRPAGVAPRPCR